MTQLILDPYEGGPGTGRKASLTSHYRTSCSVCRLGIFAGQQVVWTRGQYLGFSHAECAADLCPVCGKHAEGLALSGHIRCTLCAVVLERFGDPAQLAMERFTPPERTRR